MCSGSGGVSSALTALVEEAVEVRMKAREPFTALDISNGLKARRLPVRHGEVAGVVREIFASGAMNHYDYDRRRIDVVTDGGAKRTQTFLYLHEETKEREYTDRAQNALPPVPADQACSLDDAVPANNPLSPLVAAGRARQGGARQRRNRSIGGAALRGDRRDGALPIPRALAREAGWSVGDVLALSVDASAQGGFTLTPGEGITEKAVRVWGELRVRVCRTKLAEIGLPGRSSLQFSVEGSVVRVLP